MNWPRLIHLGREESRRATSGHQGFRGGGLATHFVSKYSNMPTKGFKLAAKILGHTDATNRGSKPSHVLARTKDRARHGATGSDNPAIDCYVESGGQEAYRSKHSL